MRTSVRTDATGLALKEVFAEMQGTLDKPITGAEFSKARESQARALPAQFETVSASAGSFSYAYATGLGLDYYSKLPAKYDAVTESEVKAMADQYLKRERFIFSAAGDRAKIEPELKALGFKKVEIRDTEGKLVTDSPVKAEAPKQGASVKDMSKDLAK
jgi:zinc protease